MEMRRFAALLLAAMMVLGLCGCEKTPEAADFPADPVPPAQELYGDPDQIDGAVTEPIRVTVEDRYAIEYPHPGGGFYCCHMPEFVLSNGMHLKLNAQIEEDVAGRMNEHQTMGDQPGVAIHYFSGQKEEITTIVVEIAFLDYEFWEYMVYSLREDTLEPAQPEEILAAFGYTPEEGAELVRSRLEEYFRFCYGQMEESMADFFAQQLETTLSEENLEQVQLFIDEENQLSMLAPVYGFAGAAYYYHRIRLEGPDFTVMPEVIRCRTHR